MQPLVLGAQGAYQLCVYHLAQMRCGEISYGALAQKLIREFALDYAMVVTLDDDRLIQAQSLALCSRDSQLPSIQYLSSDAPCHMALAEGIFSCNQNLQAQFPQAHFLKDLGVQSYLGMPILDGDAQIMGLLVVMHSQSVDFSDELISVMHLFADRIGTELERERREHKQRASQKQLQDVLDATQLCLISTDLQGTVRSFNLLAEQWLGYQSSEVVGHFNLTFFHEWEEIQKKRGELELLGYEIQSPFDVFSVLPRHQLSEERIWNFVCKNGSRRQVHMTLSAIRDSQGQPQGFLAMAKDITLEMSAQNALLVNQRRLQSALEASGDAIWEWDLQEGSVYFSERWYKMLGYHTFQSHWDLEAWKKLCHPHDVDVVLNVIHSEATLKEAQSYAVEFRMLHADGQYRWIFGRGRVVDWDRDGHALLLTGTNVDISDRKKVEEELLENRRLFQDLFEYSPDPCLILDEGIFVECNQAAVDLLGYPNKRKVLNLRHWEISPDRQPGGARSSMAMD